MDLNNANKRLLENQKEVRKVLSKRRVFERMLIGLVSLVVVSGVAFYYSGYSIPFSFESIQTSVSNLDLGVERTIDAPIADQEPGNYSKQDLYVGLTYYAGPGDIRYSLEQAPTLNSALYGGYGINVYESGVPTRTLYAMTVDPFGNMSEVAEYEYNFVPDKVDNFRAIPLANGRVDLLWNASTDPDFSRYNVYVDGGAAINALTNTVFTVSGLLNQEHTFAVTVVDNLGMESERVERRLLLQEIVGEEFLHSAAQETSPDLNGDGVVDHNDLRFILEQIEGGPSLSELDELMRCWEIPGCV